MVALMESPLRLKPTSSPEEKSGRERRVFPRRDCQERVQGLRLDHSIPARQRPHLSLSLRDLSVGGLAATTQSPIAVGENVAVFFPPQGIQKGWDARGRVLRCEPAAFGYHIAMEFEAMPMAA